MLYIGSSNCLMFVKGFKLVVIDAMLDPKKHIEKMSKIKKYLLGTSCFQKLYQRHLIYQEIPSQDWNSRIPILYNQHENLYDGLWNYGMSIYKLNNGTHRNKYFSMFLSLHPSKLVRKIRGLKNTFIFSKNVKTLKKTGVLSSENNLKYIFLIDKHI